MGCIRGFLAIRNKLIASLRMKIPVQKLRLVKPQSLSNVAQAEIERRIIRGALVAGDRVNENALATELGISRGPIREACRALAEQGLLDFIVNRGCFVRDVSQKDAVDVYDVRAGLMRLAGQILGSRITDEQITRLSGLVAEMDVSNKENAFERFYALNRTFHDHIVEFTGNDRLRTLCEGLEKELHLYRRQSLSQGGGLEASNQEHKEILSALTSRDPERSGLALEAHILSGKVRFLGAADGANKQNQSSTQSGARS
jgi:DNA-binding GntR family transcriptional regulator